MIDTLRTAPEHQAAQAASLRAFDGINLLGIKRELEIIVGLIGRNGIFDEYTRHDISHIDAMLNIVDWLIPESTKAIMTPADWLMIVLAVYFHDVGMLVTKNEFSERNSSDFPAFRDNELFAGSAGVDFRSKVDSLHTDEAERFLYQEFVRRNHATRSRDWVTGKISDRLGASGEAAREISSLLGRLDGTFRRDLGVVCESHHLNDLNDVKKYKLSQPYGNSDEETANLQYAAIVLRAADLLHITSDRTPSQEFRLINPSDPISQKEWAKQMAVRRVRAQFGKNRDGVPSQDAPRDTIEVHASFNNPDGFFGLTSYLTYVKSQLVRCHNWVTEAGKLGSKYEFPWRFVDDQFVEAEGFLKESFEFTIDQAKILDLLTGHTLYNETSVVVRELAQNALDAIRLKRRIVLNDGLEPPVGHLAIKWESVERVLSIQDNGTGMSQSTIERHLLKVGSSRYQDPEFKRSFPDFSPISRFGIGVLSAFMIADEVEVLTSEPADAKARLISLRSVHGRYLIQLLEKDDPIVPRQIADHGTLFRLRVRASAELPDIVETARRWIVVPECRVTVVVDHGEPTEIGYSSPKAALDAALKGRGVPVTEESEPSEYAVRVEERIFEGLSIAYATKWQKYYGEWALLTTNEIQRSPRQEPIGLGVCIEGIRVEHVSPGYATPDGVAAIVNAKGPTSPKTNVARSGLEATVERNMMLKAIYACYADHIRAEMDRMQREGRYSLTWAAQEAQFLLRGLVTSPATSFDLLTDVVFDVPFILVEAGGERRAVSVNFLRNLPGFWMVTSQFFRSAEYLIREVASSSSLGALINALKVESLSLPKEEVVCETSANVPFFSNVFDEKEVSKIRIDRRERRVDVYWVKREKPLRWRSLSEEAMSRVRGISHTGGTNIFVCVGDIETEGITDEHVVLAFRKAFIIKDTPIARFLNEWLDRMENDTRFSIALSGVAVFAVVYQLLNNRAADVSILKDDQIRQMMTQVTSNQHLVEDINVSRLSAALRESLAHVFDPMLWARRD